MNHRADEIQLIVSELVANAAAASADKSGDPQYIKGRIPVIRVCLLSNWALLRAEIWDQAPGIPLLRNPADLEESGRGLSLVSRLMHPLVLAPCNRATREVCLVRDLAPQQIVPAIRGLSRRTEQDPEKEEDIPS
jgi:anti-sigma regulatory factor (Ser/Thr protein kinase)